MKKAVSLIVATAAVAALASGFLVWRASRQTPPLAVAKFLSPETILLIEAPDWPRTRLRWRETALWKIVHEPEVASFLQRPLGWIGKNAPSEETMERLGRAQVHRAFFAVASIRRNMPQAAAGFEFSGDRAELEKVIAKVRAQASAASPGGKAERIRYREFEIESFSDKGVTLAGAFARDWYFFGNDVGLLKTTLDRFCASKAQDSLAGADAFLKCAAHLPQDPDFQFYVRPSAIVDEVLAPSVGAGRTGESKESDKLRKIQAIAGATRQEGERIHDTVFILQPGAVRQPTLTRSTLGLTSTSTLLYCAFAPAIPDNAELPAVPALSPDATDASSLAGVLNGLRARADEFGQRGVHPKSFKAALGPEFAVISDWPESALQPTLQLVGQVRDTAAARQLAQALTGSASASPIDGSDGAGYWKLTGDSPFSPVLVLTKRFLLAGLSAENIRRLPAREQGQRDTLEKAEAFSTAMASVHKPETALAYLDAKALFEHVYGWLRPMALTWANFIPHAADYMEVSKLPRAESVSKHLPPLVFSSSQTGDGILLESTGPVTFFQAAAALSAACSAAALPLLESDVLLPRLAVPKNSKFSPWNAFPVKSLPPLPASARSPAAAP
jgi:hypothetical protein